MKVKSTKIRNTLLMMTLILSTIAVMSDIIIIPVAYNIFTDFAEANMNILNYILSGTALISAISALICGPLMNRFGIKRVFFITFTIFTLGSVFGILFHNVNYIAAMRTLVGIGMGGVTTSAIAIISDVFKSEKARSSMLGLYNGAMSILGAALGWIAGIVAQTGWQNVFKIYLVSIPICVLILLFIPDNKEIVTESKGGDVTVDETFSWKKVIPMNTVAFVINIIYCVVYYKVSMIAIEKGILDTGIIGMITAFNTVGCFVGGIVFGWSFMKLKYFTSTVGYALLSIGFTILYFSISPVMMTVACTMIGLAYGTLLTNFYMQSTLIVPSSRTAISTSITVTIISLGSFLSIYFVTALMAILKSETITELIPLMITVLVAAIVLSIITAITRTKKDAQLERTGVNDETN